jgi:hypothetical protein
MQDCQIAGKPLICFRDFIKWTIKSNLNKKDLLIKPQQ